MCFAAMLIIIIIIIIIIIDVVVVVIVVVCNKIASGIAIDKRGYPQNIFLISQRTHMLWYSLEAPRRGASNEYPQHMFLLRNKKDISIFWMKKAPYLLLCSGLILVGLNIQNVTLEQRIFGSFIPRCKWANITKTRLFKCIENFTNK